MAIRASKGPAPFGSSLLNSNAFLFAPSCRTTPAAEGKLGLLEKGAYQSGAPRRSVPKQAGTANKRTIRQRQLTQRQPFRPRGRPVRQQRNTEPAVDHNGNQF